MAVDFIMNGVAYGDVATRLLNSGMDHRVLRPYRWTDGNSYVTVNHDGKPVAVRLATNSATLPYDAYKFFDNVIETAARPRMRAFGDLRARGNVLNIPNAMGKTMIQSQTRGRITPATMSMDGIRRSERDRPEFDINLMPIPIVHKDFSFTLREIYESLNGGPALDTMMVEESSERCAEEIEKLTLGVAASYTFGGGTIYGYGNHPARLTKTLTLPTAPGWTGKTLLTEIMQMRQQAYDKGYTGPFILYLSPNWDLYLDADFSDDKGDVTLRERILKLNGVDDIVTLDYLTGYRILMVQRTPSVARAVVGMDLQTLQWETHGGMLINFKVMGILLPQVRADVYGVTGIVDGVAA